MILIGLSGKWHSGKDSVYNFAREMIQQQVARLAFADPLKDEVSKAFGVTTDYINSNKDQFRHILQSWGMLRRSLNGNDYWISKVWKQITSLDNKLASCFITDVRFVNEAKYIKEAGGWLIRVERPLLKTNDHQSETELDNFSFDLTIKNSDDLSQLKRATLSCLEQINEKHTPKHKLKLNI